MRKADKKKLYSLLDELKTLITKTKLLNKKDIYIILNELTVLRLGVEEPAKGFSWEEDFSWKEKKSK